MECHDRTISKEFAFAAHSVSSDELRRLTNIDVTSKSLDELACAACHREHQGAQFDLTAISDAACQSCHQQRYESFSTDHPDFGRWPYERRTRIVFNHASHQAKHFVERKQAFDCKSCHVEDGSGSVQLLASYKASCAGCHNEKIATSVAGGVPMFVLPTLDVDALKAAGHDIGTWPADATGDFDGRLPPAMKLLLAGDPPAAKAIETLGPDFEFFDVDPDDEKQLGACATLATSIKSLLVELASDEERTIRTRLGTALGRPVTDAEIETLMAGVSSDLFKAAVEQWLPGTTAPEPADGEKTTGDVGATPPKLSAASPRFD
jgi:predicted CXXCH cytochrome family protein